jgi:hypothetical protein
MLSPGLAAKYGAEIEMRDLLEYLAERLRVVKR